MRAQRAEMEALVGGLEAVADDLEKAARLVAQEEVQGLGREVREMDVEMEDEGVGRGRDG